MPAKKTTGRVTPKKRATPTAAARPISTASSWKTASGRETTELEVPSGNVCLIKRPGLDAFIAKGVVPNSLLSTLMEASKGKVNDANLQRELADLVKDPKKLQDLFGMLDAILVEVVVEPEVHRSWWSQEDADAGLCTQAQVGKDLPHSARDPEGLYADDVTMEDKMFIFNWVVGGDRSVARFREEQDQLLESLSAGEDVGNDA